MPACLALARAKALRVLYERRCATKMSNLHSLTLESTRQTEAATLGRARDGKGVRSTSAAAGVGGALLPEKDPALAPAPCATARHGASDGASAADLVAAAWTAGAHEWGRQTDLRPRFSQKASHEVSHGAVRVEPALQEQTEHAGAERRHAGAAGRGSSTAPARPGRRESSRLLCANPSPGLPRQLC